jgi:predicted amidohydrolase
VLGSLAVKVEGEERAANRTFVIDAKGQIAAQYDKIHMFDVDLAAKNGVGVRLGAKAAPIVPVIRW